MLIAYGKITEEVASDEEILAIAKPKMLEQKFMK